MRKKQGEKAWGSTHADKCVIYMNKDLRNPGNEDLLEHTWEHELTHALMFAHGETDHDEVFVDGIAGLRCQYNQTRRGDTDGNS